MIESITISGFQTHKRFHLDLDKNITTIVGLNDKGKTTIVRALWWLASNDPKGLSFINWHMDHAKVVCCVDGHRIVRYRSKSRNYYKIDDSKPYKAPGHGVPSKVKEILNLDRVNFQFQRDPIFLLGNSPSQISKELNSVIDLSIMDRFLKNLFSEVRKFSIEENLVKKRLAEAKKIRNSLSWVPNMELDYRCLKQLNQYKDDLKARAASLSRCLGGAWQAASQVRKAGNELVDARRLVTLAAAAARRAGELDSLRLLLEEYRKAEQLTELDVSKLEKMLSVLSYNKTKLQSLRDILSRIEETEFDNMELDALQHQLRKATKGKCPTCGRKW